MYCRYKTSSCRRCPSIFKIFSSSSLLGDCSAGVPPVPIPNTEVKPCSPDGTARASVWESRTLPELKRSPGTEKCPGLFCILKPMPDDGTLSEILELEDSTKADDRVGLVPVYVSAHTRLAEITQQLRS